MSWGRLLCYDFHSIDALGMGSVSYLYYRPFFTRGSKVLPLFFLCKVSARLGNVKTRFAIAEP